MPVAGDAATHKGASIDGDEFASKLVDSDHEAVHLSTRTTAEPSLRAGRQVATRRCRINWRSLRTPLVAGGLMVLALWGVSSMGSARGDSRHTAPDGLVSYALQKREQNSSYDSALQIIARLEGKVRELNHDMGLLEQGFTVCGGYVCGVKSKCCGRGHLCCGLDAECCGAICCSPGSTCCLNEGDGVCLASGMDCSVPNLPPADSSPPLA
eukprot:TRINITY_DN6402_c1_g2_i1.p1 TRINITY_DN6402_c1_g2~~TRINITY_DN6402_c1_g2_i1.p1  ORF type:complete len:211 (-),score=29.52 TRINITY_DN6402_c1_g2_i1:51-683(-)